MKKIFYVLSVLLLSMALIGVASAFTYEEAYENGEHIYLSDYGSLVPGQEVTAKVSIKIPIGYGIKFKTDLDNDATWVGQKTYKYSDGGNEKDADTSNINQHGCIYQRSYYEETYGGNEYSSYVITIKLIGKVPASSKGSDIKILTITQDPKPDKIKEGEYVSDSTKPQRVYDTEKFHENLSSLKTQISNLKEQLPSYQRYNVSTKEAESYLKTAEGEITNAKTAYDSHDNDVAFKSLAQAKKSVDDANRAISNKSLQVITLNYNDIDEIVDKLEKLGKTSEAGILTIKNGGIRTEYEKLSHTLTSGGIPDTYKCLTESDELLTKANKYLEDATKNPLSFLLDHWWILLIIAGVGVIVSVVIILIRRRNNSWDELG